MGKAENCPFCGCKMSFDKKGFFIYGDHKEFCFFQIIDNQNRYDFTKAEDFEKLKKAWNKRA